MMLAHTLNRTRLRPLVALFFREAHLGADIQAGEFVVEYAVAVKIDGSPVRCFNPAVTSIDIQLGDASVRRHIVVLLLAPPATLGKARALIDLFTLGDRPEVPLDLIEVPLQPGMTEGDPFQERDGLRLWFEPVEHGPEAVGMRAEAAGRVLGQRLQEGHNREAVTAAMQKKMMALFGSSA